MRLYLAHPFDSRAETRQNEFVTESLCDIELFNPFYDAEDRKDIEQIDSGGVGRYEKLDPFELVQRDLRGIRDSDGLLGLITGDLSYGTLMEIVYADHMGKMIFLIVTNGHEKHPWLRYHAGRIFTSWDEFRAFLCRGKEHNGHTETE